MRVMLAQGHGSIVNLSSTFGEPRGAGASMYVASKHAVEGLTESRRRSKVRQPACASMRVRSRAR